MPEDRTAPWRARVDEVVGRAHGLSPDEKDDVRQECYLEVLEAADRLAAMGATIALAAVDRIVRAHVRTGQAGAERRDEQAALTEVAGLTGEDPAGLSEMMTDAGLTMGERETITLMFVDGLSEVKIAKMKGWTRWRIRTLKKSGLERMRRRMER